MIPLAEAIRAARELDPSFTADRHPFRVLINQINRLHRRLVGEWVKHEHRGYVEVLEIPFPLTDFAAGFPLVDETESGAPELKIIRYDTPLDQHIKGLDEPRRLDLVSYGDRHRNPYTRVCWIRDGVLFFNGVEEAWNDVEKVELTYTPVPDDILYSELDTAELKLPLTAEDTVINWLAFYMARRSKDEELANPKRDYKMDALDAESLWIDELKHRKGAVVSRVREAY